MSAAFDINDIAAAALGSRISKPVAPLESRGGRLLATVRALALADADVNKQTKKATMIVIDRPSEAVRPAMNVRLLHSGRVARFPVTTRDAAEAKRVSDIIKAGGKPEFIMRHAAGTYDLEIGTVFVALLGMNESELPRAGTEYTLNVSEVSSSDFGLQFVVSSLKKEAKSTDMPVRRYQLMMAAMMHAAQSNPHLQPKIYTGKVESKEGLRGMHSSRFTPETRPIKNASLVLPLVRDMPTSLFAARILRGLQATWFRDPALSLLNPMHWPAVVEVNKKMEKMARLVYRVDAVEKVLQDERFKDRVVTKEDFDKAYATYEPSCEVTLGGVGGLNALAAFGVCDDRQMFKHGAWRYLIVATPALIPVFMSGDPLHESQVAAGMTQYQLSFRISAAKESRSEFAVHAFAFEGVVNAGYPVPHKAVTELLAALAAQHGKRYNTNMANVPARLRKLSFIDEDADIPSHRVQQVTPNSFVVNILEMSDDMSELPPDQWAFCVIPNMAAKCEATNSLGYACLMDLVQAHGEDGAAEILGDAFVTLARGGQIAGPANVAAAFRPEEPRDFNFLLFAVSRRAMAEAGYSFLSSRNHVGALERIYAELYPADLSDMADATVQPIAAPDTTVQPLASTKRAADEEDAIPPAKRTAIIDEEMAGIDEAAFEDD